MTTGQQHSKQWNVHDFEHYHSGKMPEAEMHALEKAALDDPFLQDALDGYVFTKTPVEDIEALRKRLQPKKEQAKLIWYRQKSTSQFLKIAAMLVLFAGLAWLLYPTRQSKREEIASVTDKVAPRREVSSAPIAEDTQISSAQSEVATVSKNPAAQNASPAAGNVEIYKQEEKNKADQIVEVATSDDENIARTKDLAALDVKEMDELKKRKREEEAPSKKQAAVADADRADIIQGTVVDKQGQPVAFANVKVPNSNTNVSTDANGKFYFNNTQNIPSVPVNVNATGYEQATAAVSASNSNKIVLQENDKALSEVVVVGYGTTKKANRSAAPMAEKLKSAPVKHNRIELRNGQPVDGWDDFDRSITEQMKSSNPIDTTGEVVLSFDIDNFGAANNISVVKPLCDSCDARAKRMLQNAPAIKKIKRSKKVQAVVRF